MLTPAATAQLNTDRRMRIGGKSEPITRKAVEGMAELQMRFYYECLSLPYFAGVDRSALKSADVAHKSWTCDCKHHNETEHEHEGTKAEGYHGNAIAGIEALFRSVVGDAEANKIFTAGRLWKALAAGKGSPLGLGYAEMITEAFRWAWGNVNAAFGKMPRLFQIQAGAPKGGLLAYNEALPWIQTLENRGFDLVTAKITKLQLPKAMQIIANGIKARVPAQQLAQELQAAVGEGGLYHWRRLVRTEMATAIDRASKAQYKAAEIPYVKWNASRNACPKCAAIASRNMGYYTLAAVPEITADTHPNCLCNCSPVYRLPKDLILN